MEQEGPGRRARAGDTGRMSNSLRIVMLVSLAAACTVPAVATASEQDERDRLQAAHDATLRLELRGRLDTDALARGVREVRAWWTQDSPAVNGEVDEHGVLCVRLPAMQARAGTPILHVVDSAGAHWCCEPNLDAAPPTGVFDLGELPLVHEPDSPTVVDDGGRALPNAHVLFTQRFNVKTGSPDVFSGTGSDFETVTDEHGRAQLCRAAPFGDDSHLVELAVLVVRHGDFAPWWGSPTSRIQLDHGGEVRGRVVLPPGADASDFAVSVWVEEAAPRHIRGDGIYANVTAPLARDGSYRLRNVPAGARRVGIVSRHSIDSCGSETDVTIGSGYADAPGLTLDPDLHPPLAMRIRLLGEDGRQVTGGRATIHVSDIGAPTTLQNGALEWVEHGDEPFAISVPGYACSARTAHHTGETIQLRGGHRLALRLALDSARQLPPGCTLRASVSCLEDDDTGFASQPICYEDESDDGYASSLTIARDANVLVTSVGRYAPELDIVRWDAEAKCFDWFAIDVEPREFTLRADAESTLVTLTTRFVEAPR